MFSGEIGIVEGPVRDRWGTWVSVLVPVRGPQTGGGVEAVFGMDIAAGDWTRMLAEAGLPPFLLTVALAGILLAGAALLRPGASGHGGEPRSIRTAGVALVVAAGIACTLFVAWVLHERETLERGEAFGRLSASATAGISDTLHNLRDTELEGLAHFLEANPDASRAEFRRYTAHLTKNPAVQEWVWVPEVAAAGKARFEESACAAGWKDFEIWQKDADGNRVPAGGRDFYYPVLQVAPEAGHDAVWGFDMGSEPRRRAAMEEAARTGFPVASEPVTFMRVGADTHTGMVIFRPVFSGESPGRPLGFATAALRTGTLLGGRDSDAGLPMQLSLLHKDRPPEVLASTGDAAGDFSEAEPVRRIVFAFDRVFAVTTAAGREFTLFGYHPGKAALPVLAIGLLITATLGGLVGVLLRRREERKAAEESLGRLARLHGGLLECNHNIVHSASADELFPKICRAVVRLGGMKMAWVGLADEDTGRVRPVASDGSGTDYLDDLAISVHADDPRGCGPTGTAIRENRPVWCRDFRNDPSTAPWRELGKQKAWASSAALPLSAGGKTIGALTIYSDVIGAFDDKVVRSLLSVANDISFALEGFAREDSRKRAEEEARVSEARHRSIIHAAMDGFCLVDLQGRIREVNEAYCRMTGYSAEELAALGLGDLEAAMSQEEIVEQTGRIIEAGEARFESRQRRKDGSVFDVEVSVQYRAADGMLVSFLHDITERNRAQRAIVESKELLEQRVAERTEELRRSEEQYRMLFESSRDAIITTDAMGRCIDCNQAAVRMFRCADRAAFMALGPGGMSPEFQPDGRPSVEAFARVIAELAVKGSLFIEWEHRRADGTTFPAEVALSCYQLHGRPVLHGLLRDISRRKKAELELREAKEQAVNASNAKSAFLASMSHEIRTPMNAILGFSQLMLRDPGLAAAHRKHLETINRSGEHLLVLINDILDMAKIEAGRLELKPAPFDLQALLHDLDAMFRLRTDSKGLRFEVIKANDLPRVCVADKGKLLQVLINLLGNAVKFTSEGGIVLRVSLDRSGPRQLVFDVEDTGIGIAEELVGKLFQPFVQVHGEHHPVSGPGSGLGLSISREIAVLMGGDISVTSTPGQGSAFRFSIPCVEGEMKAAEDRPHHRRVAGPRSGREPVTAPGEQAALPAELVEKIRAAAGDADHDLLVELIGEVETHSAGIAQAMAALARRYDYRRLLDLLGPLQGG